MSSAELFDQIIPYLIVQIYRSITNEPCLDISHEKTLKDLMDTSPHAGQRSVRQWTYQTCTEFGFCTTHI